MKTTKGVKVLVTLPLILFPLVCEAKVTGQCGNCHTMHNSQGGDSVVMNWVTGSMVSSAAPNDGLLNTNCIGCHQGINGEGKHIPYVLQTSEPTYGTNTLAGGNFYWVTQALGDTKGHNVAGISAAAVATPPGWNAAFNANTQVGDWTTTQLTCAGTNGCHGKHGPGTIDDVAAISGAHHTNDPTIDGSTTGKSFRFLYGIIGYEDSDWELVTSAGNHNQYYGYDRTNDTPPAGDPGIQSINYLCAECHGNFHSGAGDLGAGTDLTAASPWLRHPTDFDMNDLAAGTEYKNYGGVTHVYQPLVPLASTNVSAPLATVLAGADDAIVSCVSCHRAHGSPYDALLRWDYKAWPGVGDNGCILCHTSKD